MSRLHTIAPVVLTVFAMLAFASCGRADDPQTPALTPLTTGEGPYAPTPFAAPLPSPTAMPRPTLAAVPPTLAPPTPAPDPTFPPSAAAPLPHELPERDPHALAERLGGLPKGSRRTLEVVHADRQPGHRQEFFVVDIGTDTTYTVDATLREVSPNAYWYVDDELTIENEDIRTAAGEYEDSIRPKLLQAFGDVWNPGVDGDPRLTVLHTDLGGNVAGYFDARHELPRHTHPHSNEREMLFMDGASFRPGSPEYMKVLAHELQHAIHWAHDPGEEAWVNEGLSEVAAELAGYSPSFIDAFLDRPSTQLTFWVEGRGSIPHYGAATLFMLYLLEHYGDDASLRELIAHPADGIRGINAFLRPHSKTFDDVYADWIAANYLDSDAGPYGYSKRQVRVGRIDRIEEPGDTTGHLAPYSSRYFDLSSLPNEIVLEFQGDVVTRQIPAKCHRGQRCWWSNRGDSIDTTLTRRFDLTGLSSATLEFMVWFEIEEGWDYAYVEASADGGETWTILKGVNTTEHDPVGNNYGHGFTGTSNAWLEERIDLTPFAGSQTLVRFEYVTDGAVYESGFVIDDVAVPELDFLDDAESDVGWNAQGFRRIDNNVPVDYLVLLMERRRDGPDTVRRMEIDQEKRGTIEVVGLGQEVEHAAVVVSPIAPNTHQLSRFTLTVREKP